MQLAKVPRAVAQARRVAAGGGPSRLRVRGLSQPTGLIIPSLRLKLELEARNGAKADWQPEIPVPFPYAWAYRLSRRLGMPVISSHDPEDLTFSVRLPGGRRKRRG